MIIIHNDANISILLNKNGFKNKSFMDRKKINEIYKQNK